MTYHDMYVSYPEWWDENNWFWPWSDPYAACVQPFKLHFETMFSPQRSVAASTPGEGVTLCHFVWNHSSDWTWHSSPMTGSFSPCTPDSGLCWHRQMHLYCESSTAFANVMLDTCSLHSQSKRPSDESIQSESFTGESIRTSYISDKIQPSDEFVASPSSHSANALEAKKIIPPWWSPNWKDDACHGKSPSKSHENGDHLGLPPMTSETKPFRNRSLVPWLQLSWKEWCSNWHRGAPPLGPQFAPGSSNRSKTNRQTPGFYMCLPSGNLT